MSIHSFTRNPGWSRLFWVVSGLWWCGVIIFFVGAMLEGEKLTSIEQLNSYFGEFETEEVISTKNLSSKYAEHPDTPEPKLPEGFSFVDATLWDKYQILDGVVSVLLPNGTTIKNIPDETTKEELVKRVYLYEKDRINDKRKSLFIICLPFFITPFVLLFFMRLLRYAIEGFSSEDNTRRSKP